MPLMLVDPEKLKSPLHNIGRKNTRGHKGNSARLMLYLKRWAEDKTHVEQLHTNLCIQHPTQNLLQVQYKYNVTCDSGIILQLSCR